MDGYNSTLHRNGDMIGISKISVQTGTSHGGVVLPDGSIAAVKLDLVALEALSRSAREDYGLGGRRCSTAHPRCRAARSAISARIETAEIHLGHQFPGTSSSIIRALPAPICATGCTSGSTPTRNRSARTAIRTNSSITRRGRRRLVRSSGMCGTSLRRYVTRSEPTSKRHSVSCSISSASAVPRRSFAISSGRRNSSTVR